MGSRASHISFWALSLDPGSHYTPFKYPEIYDNKALAVMRVYNPMSKVSSPVEGTQWLCPCSAVTFCRLCWSGQSFSCLQFRMEEMSLQKDKGMKCSMEYFGIGTVNMSRVWPKELNTSQSTNGGVSLRGQTLLSTRRYGGQDGPFDDHYSSWASCL